MAHIAQMTEHEATSSLEEAICNQQQLLQKLYTELDSEREASASAASEALSMILRLQGEKAAMKLEASQYRRMTEERIYIVEEHLAAYEELILQKEMEIASLEHQIESYRYKLMSVSGRDIESNEERYSENLFFQKSGSFGDMDNANNIRRLQSLPAMKLRDSENRFSREFEKTAFHKSGFIKTSEREFFYQNSDLELNLEKSASGDLKSRWELIRNILEEMKGITDANDVRKYENLNVKSDMRLQKSLSTLSTGSCYETPRCQPCPELDQINEFENRLPSQGSVNIHDVFEVPRHRDELVTCEEVEKEKCKVVVQKQKKIRKLNIVPEENLQSDSENDETECIKTMLLSTENETTLELSTEKKFLSKLGDGKRVGNQSTIVGPATSSVSRCEAEIQLLSQRMMRLEGEKTVTRNEITQAPNNSAELQMLKEIQEQLNSIRSEMKSWKSEKSKPADDWRLATLQENHIQCSQKAFADVSQQQWCTFGFSEETDRLVICHDELSSKGVLDILDPKPYALCSQTDSVSVVIAESNADFYKLCSNGKIINAMELGSYAPSFKLQMIVEKTYFVGEACHANVVKNISASIKSLKKYGYFESAEEVMNTFSNMEASPLGLIAVAGTPKFELYGNQSDQLQVSKLLFL
ncbi:hypothetical protein ACFE04_008256 [Oxalis oulophora]